MQKCKIVPPPSHSEFLNVMVQPEQLHDLMAKLKRDEQTKFDYLFCFIWIWCILVGYHDWTSPLSFMLSNLKQRQIQSQQSNIYKSLALKSTKCRHLKLHVQVENNRKMHFYQHLYYQFKLRLLAKICGIWLQNSHYRSGILLDCGNLLQSQRYLSCICLKFVSNKFSRLPFFQIIEIYRARKKNHTPCFRNLIKLT